MRPRRAVAIICTVLVALGATGCRRRAEPNAEGETKTHARAEAEAEQLIKVPLPKADREPMSSVVIINVKADGSYVINQISYDLETVDAKLRDIAAAYRGEYVIIRGENEAEFAHVARLLKLCQRHRLWNICFAVRREAPDEGGGQ